MIEGSIPTCAQDTILASGSPLTFSLCASSRVESRTQAAPSLIVELFPAVTVPLPSLMNAGRNFESVSEVVLTLGDWSCVTVTVSKT